jgi:Spy/CpxP family protein refolding chaperone
MLHKMIIAGALVGGLSCLAQQAKAQDSRPIHGGAWPIQGGVKHQPTRGAVGGEFTPGQQNETDRLYDELMQNNFSATHHPGDARSR